MSLDSSHNGSRPLTDKEKLTVRQLVESYDKNKRGTLEFDEFLGFMKAATGLVNLADGFEGEVPECGRVSLYQVKFLYDGMDLNGKNKIVLNDISDCFIALKEKNFKKISKIIFMGCDHDRKKKINIEEVKTAVQNLMKKSSMLAESKTADELFVDECIREFGKSKKELEYWEFYKVLTGDSIDPGTDPYDEVLGKKSFCCTLI